MPTIGSILSNATTGLRAQQAALAVVSHNIANAAAEGYARQRVVLSSNPALQSAEGVYGTGARIADVEQVRDALLDGAFRAESANAEEHRARADLLGRIETVLGEPSDQALSGVLDRFLSAWSDLAGDPTSGVMRAVVRQRGQGLVDKMRTLATDLDAVRQDVEVRVTQGMDRVNALTEAIARLNREVVSVESAGTTAGDLRDARARALDELATLIPVCGNERANGSVGVEFSGYNIVDGAYSSPLEVVQDGDRWRLRVEGRASFLSEEGGRIGGMLEVLNSDLPDAVASLDELAAALVEEVNRVHQGGVGPSGETGVPFFSESGTTAWSMSLSPAVRDSAEAVVAGSGDSGGNYRAGANDVALGIASLRDGILPDLGGNPGEHLRGLVSRIGIAVRSSQDAAEVHRTLADQADVRRLSLSSVSVDEELVRLIQYQSAYRAAAQVVRAADEMLRSLLAV
ncbi:MAG TPA: flagellar hook-associated protein FlgK [Longimicrobiales bacterium]|nr:flagellar hook-associated protein FlgK [Longimicrobiales bacterium]